MKRSTLNILRIAGIAVLAAAFVLLGLLSRKARFQRTCDGVVVEFSDSFNFVTEEDIKGYIDRYAGNYIGRRLDSLDLNGIENMLNQQSAVLRSEVYSTGDGTSRKDYVLGELLYETWTPDGWTEENIDKVHNYLKESCIAYGLFNPYNFCVWSNEIGLTDEVYSISQHIAPLSSTYTGL